MRKRSSSLPRCGSWRLFWYAPLSSLPVHVVSVVPCSIPSRVSSEHAFQVGPTFSTDVSLSRGSRLTSHEIDPFIPHSLSIMTAIITVAGRW